ncbi:hypothetical protein H310_01593 [Aphanomyces invadans]|uniref:Choline/carnitine acyltransferase domain-containing protein n=1 Tax=Aphanomyces invadans TaxID=157072 RepID=A0A024UT76_9STRA|nr:hypothetical protein H310_01593 [Aphanomyces invadans]ETW09160.1 hypothetical protein H310_01593 [Aphanomyces invadans]|eukprot:XP_008862965.1 hypothetical protein H310_01593 [Aphanomyces invadans]
MAEARAAVHVYDGNRRGVKLLVSQEGSIEVTFVIPSPSELRSTVVRHVHYMKNTVQNVIYPVPPPVAGAIVVVLIGIVASSPEDSYWRHSTISWWVWHIGNFFVPFASSIPRSLYVAYLTAWAAFAGLVLLMSVHRVILRALLGYRGWLYLAPRETSMVVTAWASLIKVLGGRSPLTFSFQSALPRMSVPPLKATLERYMKSIHPLVSDEEYKRIEALVTEFEANAGPKLQRYLVLKSWYADNYISDWWEQYVYLKGRSSIMIGSNYYVLPARYIPSTNQLARAAGVVRQLMEFKQRLDREQLPPIMLRGLVPLCMSQYTRIFSTTRLPGRDEDKLKKYGSSKHLAVNCRGRWFKVPLFRKGTYGELLSAYDIQQQLIAVSNACAPEDIVQEQHLGALTSANRTTWAEHRDTFFSEGVNRKSLRVIESAVFVLVLDDATPEHIDEQGKLLIHGNGGNRWFDKSFTMVAFANGMVGHNVEHSWADAPVMAHLWEEVSFREILDGMYDADGHCKKPASFKTDVTLPRCEQLQWNWTPDLNDAVNACMAAAATAIANFDLRVLNHAEYGKVAITKTCKMSPDAYLQLALQFAYYKNTHGTFTQTYEASMTRLYKHGRTETVRPVTDQSKAFVLAMVDPTVSNETRRKLGWAAGEAHQDLYRNAMSGLGVDRHLFTLYCVSVGMGIESPFLKDALSRPWRLSTSQQPQAQTNLVATIKKRQILEDVSQCICPGGGFGPVATDGYGVSYMIAGDSDLFFHISSDKSAGTTSSTAFAEDLRAALTEMRAVWND